MLQENANNKLPIKLWLENLDEPAWKEVENLANFPFAYHHIAMMPDAHAGAGMPTQNRIGIEADWHIGRRESFYRTTKRYGRLSVDNDPFRFKGIGRKGGRVLRAKG